MSDALCGCAKDVDTVQEDVDAAQERPQEYSQTGEPLRPVVAAPEVAR